ncbi:sister chromatid cohesion protein PDS5 homolog C-like isoform X1 [Coffea arabica]|uniref:Sister chromatid cohesion protein PDS5 homolog C-like isoform X1 n=1 Tax=Coffea arabica TaxID=13443 RepID=A0ABM4VJS6_COFAR
MTDKMSAERELEEQLKEAGGKLLQPPSSLDELLPLLDQVENFLSRVEQSPAKSMQAALSPLTNALVTDELLRHENVDVKVAVASCVSEITRITAPDAPYDDDKMKDVFQLIVSSFEGLSDESSRSYNKRALILETVAKVRSCVVMLDLECDGLIAQMFQLFLGAIRDYHPENIFSSMETIMTLVLEESEDISSEILNLLLANVKKDNQEVLPVAMKLAEKVFENCAVKLKPYLSQAVQSLGCSLDDYSEVVTAICEGPSSTEHTNENASTEQQVAKDVNEAYSGDADHDVNRSPKSIMLNGGDDLGNDNKGTVIGAQSSVNVKEHDLEDEPSADKVAMKPEIADSETRESVMLESKLEDAAMKRERKPSSSINVSESSDTSHIDGEKEVEKLPDLQDSREKDLRGSPREELSAETSKSLDRDIVAKPSSPKTSETEDANTASASLSGSLDDAVRPKKASRLKKKEISIQQETLSSDVSKKASEGRNDSEAKPHRRLGKKAPVDTDNEDKMSADVDTSEDGGGGKSDSETKQMKQARKKVDESSNAGDGYSLKRNGESKKRVRGKAASENEGTKTSAKDDLKQQTHKSPTRSAKDEGSSEETVRMSTKRKRTASKDKGTADVEYGSNLVGLKVKVWWPHDRQFYEGVIHSFDSAKKKHKVAYNDGDEEILNLKKERWELVDDGSVSSEEQGAETAIPDTASGMQRRKKGRRNPESSIKPGKKEVSPKSGAASSGKAKGTATKSGHKTEDDQKLKDRTTKSVAKSEDDSTGKAKSQRTGDKHPDDFTKTSVKSKDVDTSTPKAKSKQDIPKTGSMSKQDTPKTGIKSKSKTPQAGGDGSANGTGKIKHSSSKMKETEDLKERSKDKSTDVLKTPEGVKVKSSEASKVQEKNQSVKKRRRAG